MVKQQLLFLFPFFLLFSMTVNVYALGVSDYNQNVDVIVGETKKIEVARVYNTGNFNLTVTAKWIPETNSSTVTVHITPNPIHLQPDTSVLVYAKIVSAEELGEYKGKIEFYGEKHLPLNFTGNPSVEGGSAHATFNVIKIIPPFSMPVLPILGVVIIAGSSLITLLYVRKHRRKEEK